MSQRLCLAVCAWLLVSSRGPGQEPPRVSKLDGMPQVLIPAGDFVMGADEPDAHGRTAEFPPHRVHLDAYWLDRHEVTNTQYAAFLNRELKGDRPRIYGYCDLGNPVCRLVLDPSSGLCGVRKGYEQHPVLAVSWQGAAAYARSVKRRLPTEAEWERAARGHDGRRYPWGNEWDPKRTNTREAGSGDTRPVCSTPGDRSADGVCDLAGNAREWTQDSWVEDYYLSSPPANPVSDSGAGGRRVVRGGAWCLTEWDTRATSRQGLLGTSQRRYMGFRCAESVPKPLPPPVAVSEHVLFYAPMDGFVCAAAARGERRPVYEPAEVTYVPGRRGQAALLGDDAARRYWADFETAGNLRLEEGTVALWLQPRGWKGTDRGFRYFFMLRDENRAKFYLYRFVEERLCVLAGNGIEGQWGVVAAATTAWQDGQWIHLAVTWKDRSVTLYVDGRQVGRTTVPPDKYFRGLPDVFSLGQSQNWSPDALKAQTAIDEVVVFARALSVEEVLRERDRQAAP